MKVDGVRNSLRFYTGTDIGGLAGRRVRIFMRCLLCADYVADRFGHLTSNIQGPCRAVAEVTGISRGRIS